MHCPQCDHPMTKTEEIVELHTRQTWYECTACGSVHTISERSDEEAAQRIGNAYRFSAQARGLHT